MSYPSDVNDNEWLEIQDFFESEHPGRPWKYARRDIYNAIRYVQRSGCQWRMLPKEFPPWSVVYITFYRLSMRGVWQKIQDHLREKVREKCEKNPCPSVAIIDTQSVKTVQKGKQRGYDAHKKVKGRKRHIAVDTLGLVLAVVVHSAGISDSRGAHILLTKLFRFFPHLLKILCDAGYKSGVITWAKAMFGYVVEVVNRFEAHTFAVLPKRWIVERTFGWIILQRRLAKDYEHNPKISENMIYISASTLALRRLHPL